MATHTTLAVQYEDEEAFARIDTIGDPVFAHSLTLMVVVEDAPRGAVTLRTKTAADMRKWANAVAECASKAEAAEAADTPADLTPDELTGEGVLQ